MSDELQLLDRYWRAANYLSVGQIYLLANPLLRETLTIAAWKIESNGNPRTGALVRISSGDARIWDLEPEEKNKDPGSEQSDRHDECRERRRIRSETKKAPSGD